MSARRQLLAVDDFIVFDPVKILDARDFVVTAAFIEPHRRRVAFLRRRFDEQHPSAFAPHLIFHEAEQQLSDALTLLLGIDGDPVKIEYAVGERRRTVADVALNFIAVGFFEYMNDVLALLGIVAGLIDELHRANDFFFGEMRGSDQDFLNAFSIARLGGTDFHGRWVAAAAMISAFRKSSKAMPAASSALRKPLPRPMSGLGLMSTIHSLPVCDCRRSNRT